MIITSCPFSMVAIFSISDVVIQNTYKHFCLTTRLDDTSYIIFENIHLNSAMKSGYGSSVAEPLTFK